MLQIWEYEDGAGNLRRGAMEGFSDYGGSDLVYRFNRLGEDGRVIVYDDGLMCLDLVAGSRLKRARRIGAMREGEAFVEQADE